MADKIYCGSAKIVTTKFGDLTKVSFHKDDINKIVKYMKETSVDWINLVIKEKREKVEGKPTHYLEVDTWKPDSTGIKQEEYKSTATDHGSVQKEFDNSLPF